MTKQRYFRVGAFYRDENSKSVIVQCYDRREAETWIPGAKAMLYPGENTEDFRVHIFEFQLQINLNNLNHYRITVERPVERAGTDFDEETDYDGSLTFDAVVEAKDADEAKKMFFEDWFDLYARGHKPEEYDIYIDEIPLEEMIEKEQRMLKHRLICRYASEKLKDLPAGEFVRLMREDDSDEKDQMYYEELRDLLKRLRLSAYLEKRLETDKLSHAEFCEIRDALCSAKAGEEFERINFAATEKYGKAVCD